MRGDSWKVGKNSQRVYELFDRAPVAQLVEYRAATREVVSSTPAGPSLRVLK